MNSRTYLQKFRLDFPRQPPLPPSLTQGEERKKRPPLFGEFFNLFKKLLKKNGFAAHMVAYGINIGVFAAVGTFLNQFVLQYFPVNKFINMELKLVDLLTTTEINEVPSTQNYMI